jgi:hypothetical protein
VVRRTDEPLCVDAVTMRNEMALVNDFRPDRAKNNTEAVVVQIEGRHHVFYVASQRIPANTEVRTDPTTRSIPDRIAQAAV